MLPQLGKIGAGSYLFQGLVACDPPLPYSIDLLGWGFRCRPESIFPYFLGFFVQGAELLLGPLLQLPTIESVKGGLSLGTHVVPSQDPVVQGLEQLLLRVGRQAVEEVNLGLLLVCPLGPGEPE